MKTVERLLARFADRLEAEGPLGPGTRPIWKEWEGGWWASLQPGWQCQSTQAGSCHERTLRELERALRAAKQVAP